MKITIFLSFILLFIFPNQINANTVIVGHADGCGTSWDVLQEMALQDARMQCEGDVVQQSDWTREVIPDGCYMNGHYYLDFHLVEATFSCQN